MVNVLLDTCVISELRKPLPAPSVVNALQEMDPAHTFLSVVTIGELIKGIFLLPEGRQRGAFETWYAKTEASFTDRILPVDIDVARKWGQLTARLRHQGIQLAAPDGLIAATALNHGMSVMTRNTKDFRSTGVVLINPWQGTE